LVHFHWVFVSIVSIGFFSFAWRGCGTDGLACL
jgi:hypothetical protein